MSWPKSGKSGKTSLYIDISFRLYSVLPNRGKAPAARAFLPVKKKDIRAREKGETNV